MKRRMMTKTTESTAESSSPPMSSELASGFGMLTNTLTECRVVGNAVAASVTLPADFSRPIWCIRSSSTTGATYLWLSGPGYVVTWNLGFTLYNIIKQTHYVRGDFIKHSVRLVKVT